jgi:hypothetical protein
MRRWTALAVAMVIGTAPAAAQPREGALLQSCILGAAWVHDVPPAAMVVLLMVEGGRLGMRSPNTNGTGDLGPFQVNEIWLPKIARYWDVPEAEARRLVRDDLCANAEAAAWIFGMNLRDSNGKLWEGVARYHSMRPDLQGAYLSKALRAVRQLRRGDKQHG